MKKSIVYLFILSIVLGSFIYMASKFDILLPRLIRNYVNDFLIIPIVLTISLFVSQKQRNDTNYTIPLSVILYLCVLYSVFFEYYLPMFHPRYTSDMMDVLLYFLGGFTFYFLQKKA